MNQTQRHEKIVNLVKQKSFVSIDELVELFQVTPQTIRRDVNQLADAGYVSRFHGGIGVATSWENTPYQDRKAQHKSAKERIAEAVAEMIPDGASCLLISVQRPSLLPPSF